MTEQIEAAAKAVYDFVMPDQDQLAVLIHQSEMIDAGKPLPEQLKDVLAICAGIARAALAAADAAAWCWDMTKAPRNGTDFIACDLNNGDPLMTACYISIDGTLCKSLGEILDEQDFAPTCWRPLPAPPETNDAR